MFQRYSRQREVVFDVLSSTDTHPTADWIYGKAKTVLPDISIATVYRNLRELVKCGRVIDVDTQGAAKLLNAEHKVERCDVTFFGICDNCLLDNEHQN